MKLNVKDLLRDRNVLYIVLFLAVMNFVGYLLAMNMTAAIFFLIVGFLTSYFSKNMIIIMLVAMLSTNFFIAAKMIGNKVSEGFTSKQKKKVGGVKSRVGAADTMNMKKPALKKKPAKKIPKESFASMYDNQDSEDESEYNPASAEMDSMEATGTKPTLDYAATLESAYNNLDKLLGSEAINSMTEDTQRLAEQQQYLLGNMQKLEPMMQKAGAMLEGLDVGRMNNMMEGLSGKMGMLDSLKAKTSNLIGGGGGAPAPGPAKKKKNNKPPTPQ